MIVYYLENLKCVHVEKWSNYHNGTEKNTKILRHPVIITIVLSKNFMIMNN